MKTSGTTAQSVSLQAKMLGMNATNSRRSSSQGYSNNAVAPTMHNNYALSNNTSGGNFVQQNGP